MSDVRGGVATPGEFRRSQNWIGPAGCELSLRTPSPVSGGSLICLFAIDGGKVLGA